MYDRELLFRLSVIVAVFALFGYLVPRTPPAGGLVASVATGSGAAGFAVPPGQPSPEPLVFEALPQDKARAINAAQAFATDRGPPAQPYVFTGDALARERATDCLAAAMLYEAGDDDRGQRAVAQVVLNRARHPSFPASVCGVVFQGSERSTGCQFTFTCDGAMARTPYAETYARTRARAREMLGGAVTSEVGLATHYHTDWVHPVWSAEMDKIAQVDTHLFFRWHGGPGSAAAMIQRRGGSEPSMAQLAALSPFHKAALPTAEAEAALAMASGLPDAAAALAGQAGAPYAYAGADSAVITAAASRRAAARGTFLIDMAPGGNGAVQALVVLDTCGERDFCKVVGRLGPQAPEDLRRRVAFFYMRDKRTGMQKAFWNCDIYRRTMAAQCLGPGNRQWLAFEPPANAANQGSARAAVTPPPASPSPAPAPDRAR